MRKQSAVINIKRYSEISGFEKVCNFFLPVAAIFQTYGWGKYDFAFIISIILILWGWWNRGIPYLKMPKLLSLYLFYYLIIEFMSVTGTDGIIEIIPVGWIRMYLEFGLFFSIINLKILEKYYTKSAWVCLVFFYIQIIVFNVTGKRIPGVTSLLPVALDVNLGDYFSFISSENYRSCSFFSEPAHFAQFLLPLLTLKLFKRNKREWIFICSIILTLLLLRSGNGIVGLGVVGICYIFYLLKNASIWKKFILLIILPVSLTLGIGYYIQSDSAQELFSRTDQLNNNANAESGISGFIRIYRGYYVYEELSPIRKIFGANNPRLIKDAISKSVVSGLFLSKDDMYFNVVQSALIRTGIIGTIILFLVYLNLFIRGDTGARTLILTIFILSFIAALYLNETMLLFFILAQRLHKHISYKIYTPKLIRKILS